MQGSCFLNFIKLVLQLPNKLTEAVIHRASKRQHTCKKCLGVWRGNVDMLDILYQLYILLYILLSHSHRLGSREDSLRGRGLSKCSRMSYTLCTVNYIWLIANLLHNNRSMINRGRQCQGLRKGRNNNNGCIISVHISVRRGRHLWGKKKCLGGHLMAHSEEITQKG